MVEYEDGDGFVVYEEKEMDPEFVGVASALLLFARRNPQLLGMLSRRDIEVVVTNGTPFLFKGAFETARRMRTFLSTNGSNAQEADNASTVDLMKYILSYARNPAVPSSQTNLYSRELVESSVRNLMQELAMLNSGTPSLGPEKTQFQDRYGQTSGPHNQNIVMKRGDWICPKCSFMNFARNNQCLECEEQKPKKMLTGGEWECPQCDFFNHGRNIVCLRCDCKRPGPLPVNPVNSMSASGYNGDYAHHSSTDHRPSREVNASDMSSTTDEDFPEIMPLRRGENRFVVSTRKTPLERRQANTSKSIASGPVGAGKNNIDDLVKQSLDKILGGSSASSLNGDKGITSGENPEAPVLTPEGGASEASSMTDSGEGKKFQISETFKNLDNLNNKNNDHEDKSGRWFKRMAELHDAKDVPSAVSDEDFPEIMPVRKGENRFVVSKNKNRSLTSPTYKRNVATEQASSSKYVPFVPFPPGYFARTEPQPSEGSVSPANSTDDVPTSPQVLQRSAGMDNSRINKDGAGAIRSTENDQISSGSNIISSHQEMSLNRNASRTSHPLDSAHSLPKTDLRKDVHPLPDYARASRGENSAAQNIGHSTNATGDSLHPPPNHNMQSGWTGKSLEGSAVKEPDPLDMSEEAKAERWFKRVAQIKDISELSQIPDEDFPSIMPMRKGVNRFVVSKRKSPMERRLTSSQYRRNLPVERNDPLRRDNNSSDTK
ncbi:hypothetical protein LIER_16246 [Lithospermum erythrorhizon]|uniref:RanBP2-type domain-containing protein n=1 Tax=Lithospermum erythrorhizon TaxID=34254 RepID=A0AAV3QA35_LITER